MKVCCFKRLRLELIVAVCKLGENNGLLMRNHWSRRRYWLSVGAQPSDPVQRLLFRAGLLPPPPMVVMGRKGGPRDTRPVDPCSGRVLMPEEPAKATTESLDV
ncbi:30S ribosomal protein S16-2, chloroplastic/mitochondrial [Tanacetum coccineum]